MRTSVYVDGFNFYYGSVRPTLYKCIGLKAVFEKVLSTQNVIASIKYFTSKVSDTPDDPDKAQRQDRYFQALKAYISHDPSFYSAKQHGM